MYHSSGVDVMDGSNAIYLIVCIVELFSGLKSNQGAELTVTPFQKLTFAKPLVKSYFNITLNSQSVHTELGLSSSTKF